MMTLRTVIVLCFLLISVGCGGGKPSEEERKESEEVMQQQSKEMSEQLPSDLGK